LNAQRTHGISPSKRNVRLFETLADGMNFVVVYNNTAFVSHAGAMGFVPLLLECAG
jgi:hypothetical protein